MLKSLVKQYNEFLDYLNSSYQIERKEINYFLLIIGLILFLPFLLTRTCIGLVDFSDSGEVGDTIGGITAPFLSILGSILIYLSLKSQVKANSVVSQQFEIQNFETQFFDMLKIYRENINDWKFLSVTDLNKNMNERYLYEGRIVANQVYGLFKELFDEIEYFLGLNESNIDLFIEETYKKAILSLNLSNQTNIVKLAEFVKIELSMIILYYGVGNISIENLKADIKGKYKDKVIDVFNFLNLKPVMSSDFWDDWLKKKKSKKLTPHIGKTSKKPTTKYYKYYGGHEHRLGHYFRHLYSIVRYVNKQPFLTYLQKWEYISMLRAQMSNKEQLLIYIFSLSFLGRQYELSPSKLDDIDKYDPIQKKFITKYDLVKYIPKGTREKYFTNNYYPDVQFIEQLELTDNRKKLEKLFK